MPRDKLGIDLDGSWVVGTYLPSGPKPWPHYTKDARRCPHADGERAGPRTCEHVRRMAAVSGLARH